MPLPVNGAEIMPKLAERGLLRGSMRLTVPEDIDYKRKDFTNPS
jgi:hypothetical protein